MCRPPRKQQVVAESLCLDPTLIDELYTSLFLDGTLNSFSMSAPVEETFHGCLPAQVQGYAAKQQPQQQQQQQQQVIVPEYDNSMSGSPVSSLCASEESADMDMSVPIPMTALPALNTMASSLVSMPQPSMYMPMMYVEPTPASSLPNTLPSALPGTLPSTTEQLQFQIHHQQQQLEHLQKQQLLLQQRLASQLQQQQQQAGAQQQGRMDTMTERPAMVHQCPHCSKSYTRANDLKVHVRSHTGEKPYKCDECGKTFVKNSHRTRHMAIHSGDKPYSCGFCNKTVSRASDLKVHLRTHTGERPYKCSYCPKSFITSSHVRTHERTHDESRSFECELCHKVLKTQIGLTQHLQSHEVGAAGTSMVAGLPEDMIAFDADSAKALIA